jgi:hypothetical protein
MRECDLLALTRAFGSSPEMALGEPGMGTHILLIFGARLAALISATYSPKGIVFPDKPLIGIDLMCPAFLPDVEALLGGVHPACDQVFQLGFDLQSSLRG